VSADTTPPDVDSLGPVQDANEGDAEPCRWSVGAAALVVVSTVVTTLVAGLLAGLVMHALWPAPLQAACVGVALGAAYVLQVWFVRFLAKRRGSSLADAVGLRRIVDPLRVVLAALFAMLVARFGTAVFAIVLEQFHVTLQGQNIDPTNVLPQGPLGMVVTIVLVCVFAPIAEEVVFRGVLLPALQARWGVVAGVIGSAAVFAAMHVSLYAFVPIGLFGLILAWLYVKTENLAVPILAHALFNSVGIIALYALKAGGGL